MLVLVLFTTINRTVEKHLLEKHCFTPTAELQRINAEADLSRSSGTHWHNTLLKSLCRHGLLSDNLIAHKSQFHHHSVGHFSLRITTAIFHNLHVPLSEWCKSKPMPLN